MTEVKTKCDNCGDKRSNLTYDCVYEKYFCDKCNRCKPEHSDEAIKKAFNKITNQHMCSWWRRSY